MHRRRRAAPRRQAVERAARGPRPGAHRLRPGPARRGPAADPDRLAARHARLPRPGDPLRRRRHHRLRRALVGRDVVFAATGRPPFGTRPGDGDHGPGAPRRARPVRRPAGAAAAGAGRLAPDAADRPTTAELPVARCGRPRPPGPAGRAVAERRRLPPCRSRLADADGADPDATDVLGRADAAAPPTEAGAPRDSAHPAAARPGPGADAGRRTCSRRRRRSRTTHPGTVPGSAPAPDPAARAGVRRLRRRRSVGSCSLGLLRDGGARRSRGRRTSPWRPLRRAGAGPADRLLDDRVGAPTAAAAGPAPVVRRSADACSPRPGTLWSPPPARWRLMPWAAFVAAVVGLVCLLFRGPVEAGLVLTGRGDRHGRVVGPGSRRLRTPHPTAAAPRHPEPGAPAGVAVGAGDRGRRRCAPTRWPPAAWSGSRRPAHRGGRRTPWFSAASWTAL